MPVLKNCEMWYVKCNPEKPDTRFRPRWAVQIRTTSREQKKEWESFGIKVTTKDPDEGPMYYQATIGRGVFKADGVTKRKAVEVVDAEMNPFNPDTIGNGSIGNVSVFQYNSVYEGKSRTANMLSGIQVLTVIKPDPNAKEYTEIPSEFESAGKTVVKEFGESAF